MMLIRNWLKPSPGSIYVDLVDGPIVVFAANAGADHVVRTLRDMGVHPGGIRNTYHIIANVKLLTANARLRGVGVHGVSGG